MKRLLLAAVALAALCALAKAADLPYKALPPTPASLWDTGGLYVGLETGAAVANTSTSTLGLNSLVAGNVKADGGYIGGEVGYMKGTAAHWYAGECDASYRNITSGAIVAVGPGAPPVAASVASRWSVGCEVRVGGSVDPLTLLANAANAIGLGSLSFGTFSPIPPPGAHVSAAPRTYMAGGFEAFGVSGDIGAAGGADVVWALRIRPIGALWQQLDSGGKPTGGVFDVSTKIVLANHGLQFNHVFDPTTNATFAGQASMGNLYAVELRYMWSPGGIVIASK
jgi:opacity protein-like surface antigen